MVISTVEVEDCGPGREAREGWEVAQGHANTKERGVLDPGLRPKWVGSHNVVLTTHKEWQKEEGTGSVPKQEAKVACLEHEDKTMVGTADHSPQLQLRVGFLQKQPVLKQADARSHKISVGLGGSEGV